jgi:hypothetical protein
MKKPAPIHTFARQLARLTSRWGLVVIGGVALLSMGLLSRMSTQVENEVDLDQKMTLALWQSRLGPGGALDGLEQAQGQLEKFAGPDQTVQSVR